VAMGKVCVNCQASERSLMSEHCVRSRLAARHRAVDEDSVRRLRRGPSRFWPGRARSFVQAQAWFGHGLEMGPWKQDLVGSFPYEGKSKNVPRQKGSFFSIMLLSV